MDSIYHIVINNCRIHPLAIHELGVTWDVTSIRKQVRLRSRRDQDNGGDREHVEVHQGSGRVGRRLVPHSVGDRQPGWAISIFMTTPFMGSESRLGTSGALGNFRAGSREYAARSGEEEISDGTPGAGKAQETDIVGRHGTGRTWCRAFTRSCGLLLSRGRRSHFMRASISLKLGNQKG
jgi:hypothetical protein